MKSMFYLYLQSLRKGKYIKISHAKKLLSVKNSHLTYLDLNALLDLYFITKLSAKKQKNGLFIEAGCALGGSAIIISMAKMKHQKLKIFDVFSMIPPPSNKDDMDVHHRYEIISSGKSKGLGDQKYYGYIPNLLEVVKENFHRFGIDLKNNNIELIKGNFQETLLINEPVSFAHIDCDWYESVITCLERIVPNLDYDGNIIIDDYNDWSGCKTAVDEYFKEIRNTYTFYHSQKLRITKK